MSNTITYKNYTGTVEYYSEDKIFYWKIAMIDDLITFEADNVSDLEKEFKKSVEEYVKTCNKLWKKPEKEFKWIFNVRIKWNLHKQAYANAIKENISLNKYVERALEKEFRRKIINGLSYYTESEPTS